MTPPIFSCVMPAYNAAATISSSIRSVLAQTRDDWELIVVDDGSADDTAERVRAFETDGRVRLLRQENRGVAAAQNTAIAEATGDYVSIIASDDLWLPTYLEEMGKALDADPCAGFAYSDGWVLDPSNSRICRATVTSPQRPPDPLPTDPEELLTLLLRRNFVCGLATIRRSVLNEVGPYNESLRSAEDYELWLRILACGYRAARTSSNLVVVRCQPGGLHANHRVMVSSRREVYRIVAEEYEVSDHIKEIALRERMRFDADLAALEGTRSTSAAIRRLHWGFRGAGHRLLWWRHHYATPPPEVAAAFPDLAPADALLPTGYRSRSPGPKASW